MPAIVRPGAAYMTDPATSSGSFDQVAPDAIVIVPRRPGPLLRPPRPDKPDDEIDEIVDELFGETTPEQPGRLDLVLLAGGLALGTWAWLTSAGALWLVLAATLFLLGAALPARSALRAYHRRRLDRARRRAIADGYVLDISDPSPAALARAYEHALRVAPTGQPDLHDRITATSHLAIVEAAALLHGGPPTTGEERGYVDKRTDAIEAFIDAFKDAATNWAELQRMNARSEATRAIAARVAVREDLEAESGLGSLARLGALRADLGLEDAPAADR